MDLIEARIFKNLLIYENAAIFQILIIFKSLDFWEKCQVQVNLDNLLSSIISPTMYEIQT